MALTKVSTDGVKDDAITKTKIPANQIEASELADNAVDTNAIADQAVALSKLPHGTSSNDGKFLRANNGADPSFETITGTTINNNADNRVITGSGSANTLNGESGLTFASKVLDFQQGNNSANTINGTLQFSNANHSVAKIEGTTRTTEDDGDLKFYTKNSGTFTEALRLSFHAEPKLQMLAGETEIVSDSTEGALTLRADPGQNRSSSSIKFDVDATVRGRFTSDGLCFGSDTAAANALDDYEEGTWTPQSNAGSLNVNTAHYVKIGSSVTFQAYVGFPSQSGSAEQLITNFPFDIASSSDYHACAINSDAGIALTGQFISGGSLKLAKSSNTKATVSEMSSRFVIFSLTIVTH